jgi:hypothetical protein
MKILIQQQRTNLFVSRLGRWVKSERYAHDFGGTYQACRFCFDRHYKNVSILLSFSNKIFNLRLDVFGDPTRDFQSCSALRGSTCPRLPNPGTHRVQGFRSRVRA